MGREGRESVNSMRVKSRHQRSNKSPRRTIWRTSAPSPPSLRLLHHVIIAHLPTPWPFYPPPQLPAHHTFTATSPHYHVSSPTRKYTIPTLTPVYSTCYFLLPTLPVRHNLTPASPTQHLFSNRSVTFLPVLCHIPTTLVLITISFLIHQFYTPLHSFTSSTPSLILHDFYTIPSLQLLEYPPYRDSPYIRVFHIYTSLHTFF